MGRPLQPLKIAPGPAGVQPAGEATFQGQLKVAIQGWKGDAKDAKQGSTGEGAKRDTAKKKDDVLPQQIVVDTAPALLPPPPAAGFGLPSAGVEQASNSGHASKLEPESNPVTAAPAAAKLIAASQTPLQIKPPVAAMEAVKSDSPAELAFALRLAALPSNQELQPQPAPAPLPAAMPVTPGNSTQSDGEVQPNETMPPPPRAVPPALPITLVAGPAVAAHAATQRESTAESGSHSGEGNPQKEKEPAKGVAKPEQPQPAELKLQREPRAGPEAPVRAVKDSPLEASNAMLTAAPAPATSSAPRVSDSAAAVNPVEPISEPLMTTHATPKSPVTDIAVTVPVSRPDASTDERVAIRMVQRGDEIHVSVRTPDTELAQSLRQDLGKLSTGLDQAGFHTETWRPTAAGAPAQSNANPHREPSKDNPNGNGSSYDASTGGGGGRNAGEQRRKRRDDRPSWVAEIEKQKIP